jgi:hypothetical protein
LLLAAAVAAVLVVADLSDWSTAGIESAAQGRLGETLFYAIYVFVGGLSAALVVFLIDLVFGVWSAAGRRSALGMNVVVQVLLALLLLIGVNVYSFVHYQRWDLSREHAFTINAEVAGELRKLRGETTVIVQQKHKSGGESARDDEYDPKAEAKVIEKVGDLVDQLREFGPQFRVVVLDVNDKEYRRKYADEVARFPGLEAAMAGTSSAWGSASSTGSIARRRARPTAAGAISCSFIRELSRLPAASWPLKKRNHAWACSCRTRGFPRKARSRNTLWLGCASR